MDGSSRVPRPTDRRVINGRVETASSGRVEEPAPAPRAEPTRLVPVHHASKEKKSRKKIFIPLIGVIVLLLAAFGGWTVWTNAQNSSLAVDSSKYQAVFFTNGQVYFGKLKPFNSEYLKLTEIYYLQTQTGEEATNLQSTDEQNNVQLIKLGNEIHGPEDEMMISKDQILFYENLKTDGNVAKSIEQFKRSN
jgi:hypothetical protein